MPADAVMAKLSEIQAGLAVPKGRDNEFGGFKYRSASDILAAVKPLAREHGCALALTDEVREVCGQVYVVSTARLTDLESGTSAEAQGVAREQAERPKMDASQLTGSASTYACKRALGNLLLIDDEEDPDSRAPSGPVTAHCRSCGARYRFDSPAQMAAYRCCARPDWEVER